MTASPPEPPPTGPLLPPVRWLFAPDLIAYAKRTFLHAFYGGDLDPRDWMRLEDGHGHVEDGGPDPGRERDLRVAAIEAPASGELWFDYLADIGDGGVAMFTTAYACGVELALPELTSLAEPRAAIGRRLHIGPRGAAACVLPRGQFLFVGGDTAYHVADPATLAARVQVPFARAAAAIDAVQPDHGPRRLYGIPGNHDYYAQLIGFGRMFRHGATDDDQAGPGGRVPPLRLPGYQRVQEASYVGIALPWDWQLLGLDIDEWIDARQEWYFRQLPRAGRLIVATPSPPIVQGAVVAGDAHRDALVRLGLPELYDGGAPAPGACRLDLSGDTHHYARYQPGAAAPAPVVVGDGESTVGAEAPADYAGVVSGAGGAFHHPSFQPLGPMPAHATYPRPAVSRRAVSRRLLEPWQIFDGGLAWIMPLVLTLTAAIGSVRPGGTRWVCDQVLGWVGVTAERGWGQDARSMLVGGPSELFPSLAFLGIGLAAVILGLAALRVHGVTFSSSQRRQPSALTRSIERLAPGPRRGLAMVLGASAVLLPFFSPWFVPSPLAANLWFNAWWVLIGVATLAGALAVGAVGGRLLPGPGRVGMLALGLFHGVAQVLTPFVIARVALGVGWVVPVTLLVLALALAAGRKLLDRGAPWWSLLALWVLPWLATIALALGAADGVALAPASLGARLAIIAITAVTAIAIGCAHMGWYLAVAAALGAHGNEVGGAARIDHYRQFIRFRLTADGLTGFVIAIDRPSADPAAIAPYVVDVFTIAPRS